MSIDNNTAEHGVRSIALGWKIYLFMGSDEDDRSKANAYTLIEMVKLNAIDPQAWLTDALSRIVDHKVNKIDQLLPWWYAHKS